MHISEHVPKRGSDIRAHMAQLNIINEFIKHVEENARLAEPLIAF